MSRVGTFRRLDTSVSIERFPLKYIEINIDLQLICKTVTTVIGTFLKISNCIKTNNQVQNVNYSLMTISMSLNTLCVSHVFCDKNINSVIKKSRIYTKFRI